MRASGDTLTIMTAPTSDFYLTLLSNTSISDYPNNGPSGFKVALPNVHELHGDEWQVGLASLIYPRTWVNMPDPTKEQLKEFRHQGVFYARLFSQRRPARYNDRTKYSDERWVPLYVPVGYYETVGDLMKGVRQALRDEFGQSLADQEFKFTFDEDAKRVTIAIPTFSVLALNPWMVDLLESNTFNQTILHYRHFPSWTKYYEQFSMLGLDEYTTTLPWTAEELEEEIKILPFLTFTVKARTDKVISWCPSHLSFQTIYIYSDVVASQVVGDVRANLLRVIAPKGSHGDVISENFEHLFYNDVRIKSFNTIEILLRGDTGRAIPFLGGVGEVTLHFRKK